MNFPRHEWNKNLKVDLLEFLKTANDLKSNEFCNSQDYKRLKPFFPLDKNIKDELQTYKEKANNVCIDITQSSEDEIQIHDNINNAAPSRVGKDSLLLSESLNVSRSDFVELAETIKDSLVTDKTVSKTLLKDLLSLNNTSLIKCFCSLAKEISLEDTGHLWKSFNSSDISNNDAIIVIYVSHLLLPKVKHEFVCEMKEVFLGLCQQHGHILKHELVNELIKSDHGDCETPNVLVQYIVLFNDDYKTDILRDFISTAKKLHPNYIPVIEALLTSQTDADVLGKVIEIMASASTEFSNNNAYGKLLFKALNSCDRNILMLEQPLKRILGTHKSIWKIKVEKIVASRFNDSLTQSFM